MKSYLSNELGGKSLMRLINFFVVIIIMLNWTYVNMLTGTLNPIGGTNLALIVAVLTGKIAEKRLEGNATDKQI